MYQMLIETSLSDLFLVLMKNNQVISFVHKKDLIKKSEILPFVFEKIINQNNLQTNQIQKFYITVGPGSFMGSRVALIFVRTICQITNASLYITNTLKFISNNIDGTYYIDAKSNQSYQGILEKNHLSLQLVSYHLPTQINYSNILKNIKSYLSLFKKVSNLVDVYPVYLKNPKVG